MYYAVALYDFVSLTIVLLIERGYFVASSLTDNPLFPTPFVLATQITTLTDNLRIAWLAYQKNPGTNEKEALRVAKEELIVALKSDASYVTGKSVGNANNIKAGGYTPSKEKSSTEKPFYDAEPGSKPGSVALYYQKGSHDKSIIWLAFHGVEPPNSILDYKLAAGTTLESFELTGYPSGEWFNFVGSPIATNSDGTFHWTPPLLVLIP